MRRNPDIGARGSVPAKRNHLRTVGSAFSLVVRGEAIKPDDDDDALRLLRFLHEIGFINPRLSDSRMPKDFRHVTYNDPYFVQRVNWNTLQAARCEIRPAAPERRRQPVALRVLGGSRRRCAHVELLRRSLHLRLHHAECGRGLRRHRPRRVVRCVVVEDRRPACPSGDRPFCCRSCCGRDRGARGPGNVQLGVVRRARSLAGSILLSSPRPSFSRLLPPRAARRRRPARRRARCPPRPCPASRTAPPGRLGSG